MKRSFIIIGVGVILFSYINCASIHTHYSVNPQLGTTRQAPVGSRVFSLNVTEDLPNIFNKADIFGGKRNKRRAELAFLGMNESGLLVFYHLETEFISNETTMSRGGTFVTAQRSGNQASLSVSTPPEGSTYPMSPNGYVFGIDPNRQKQIFTSGIIVQIVDFNESGITFILSRDEGYD